MNASSHRINPGFPGGVRHRAWLHIQRRLDVTICAIEAERLPDHSWHEGDPIGGWQARASAKNIRGIPIRRPPTDKARGRQDALSGRGPGKTHNAQDHCAEKVRRLPECAYPVQLVHSPIKEPFSSLD